MAKYAVRRISLGSTLKFGFVLGALLSLAPSLLCGLSGSWLVSTVYRVMAGWSDVRLEVLGQPVRFDLIDLLSLEGLLEQLRFLDQNDWLFALLLVLMACCVTALVLGLSTNLLTLGYNALAWLTGGLIVELRELDDVRAPFANDTRDAGDGERRREIAVEHIERPTVPREEERQLLEATCEAGPAAREEDQQLPEAAREHARDADEEDTYTEA